MNGAIIVIIASIFAIGLGIEFKNVLNALAAIKDRLDNVNSNLEKITNELNEMRIQHIADSTDVDL